ncbi:MAG: HepT-like ribonuclease domain-containing protein [Thermoanaerobaculia bacterium]
MQHLLAGRNVVANSYRDVFRRAATAKLLEGSLATRLEDAAAMRNVLVHLYDEIDIRILHQSVGKVLSDFAGLVAALEPFADAR